MTRPRPFDPNIDVADLPGIRYYARSFGMMPLANRGLRRAAKALLFHELAAGARRGVPLDTLAGYAAESPGRAWLDSISTRVANPRAALLFFVVLILTFGLIGVFALFNDKVDKEDRVARLLAKRLKPHLARGLSLAEAMRRCEGDYDPEEIAIVETAEKVGQLPEALARLAIASGDRRMVLSQAMMYPIVLGTIGGGVAWFMISMIYPKHADIYMQLGAELPWLTQAVVTYTSILVRSPLVWLVFLPPILLLLLRATLTAGKGDGVFAALIALALTWIFCQPILVIVVLAIEMAGILHATNEVTVIYGELTLLLVLLVFLPRILGYWERRVNSLERLLERSLLSLPVLGRLAGSEAEARWLAGLAVALRSGAAAHEAIGIAGSHCGGRLGARSQVAAARAAAGVPMGRACDEAGVLRPRYGARLILACAGCDVLAATAHMAEDMAEEAAQDNKRLAALFEIIALLIIGTGLGLLAISTYLPLFFISTYVQG